ncbi:MAG: radical SAM family heme chaperone HemW [Gemmataceae bacterium]|nr:radical SAM family heme chaperone HemW [Gemmataceae bacterium]
MTNAAYIHVPFCAHHCGYCDFAVAAGQDHLMELYLEALGAELAALREPAPVETIFIGGGTPTYLDPSRLQRLLAEVTRWLPLRANGEFSIESTPDSIDENKVAILAAAGVNRVSIGAQSFHPHLLRVLERRHEPAQVSKAVDAVRQVGAQVSLDLIFGVPGQTLAEWDADLRQALRLAPDHMSTYGLTYEKGTRLWKQWKRGDVRPLEEDDELALYTHAMDTLETAGFEHYEISNFARPGCRSRHNQVYWANLPHHGFGVGAARYINGRRELNTRDLKEYMRRVLSGESAAFQSEELDPEERARETIAIQIRRSDGIDRHGFRVQTGFDLDTLAGAALANHAALGFVADDGAGVRLTRRGRCVADALIRDLL